MISYKARGQLYPSLPCHKEVLGNGGTAPRILSGSTTRRSLQYINGKRGLTRFQPPLVFFHFVVRVKSFRAFGSDGWPNFPLGISRLDL